MAPPWCRLVRVLSLRDVSRSPVLVGANNTGATVSDAPHGASGELYRNIAATVCAVFRQLV